MKLERVELLEALKKVKPAIAVRELLEELTLVWFGEGKLTAYNDADIGIQVDFVSEFRGGIKGNLLISLLEASRAKQVQVELGEDDEVLFKLGGTKFKTNLFPIEKALWDFPEESSKQQMQLTPEILDAFSAVLTSRGVDLSSPEQVGVSFRKEGDQLCLYTTDRKTITQVSLSLPSSYKVKASSLILSFGFIEQVLKLCREKGQITIFDDYAVAFAPGVKIYTKVLHAEAPLDYESLVHKTQQKSGAYFEIPSKLRLALERALILLQKDEETALMTISQGKMVVQVASNFGKLDDRMSIECEDEFKLGFSPSLLKRALPFTNLMAISDTTIVLKGPNDFLYLLAGASK